jgi:hypothetical protein
MTVPLQAGSPRRIAASKFGAELRRAMKARGVGSKSLGPQAGCAPSAIAMWLAGNNLPRLETAVRLAESLQWPKLVPLARAGRTDNCQRCGAEFVNNGGKPKRFCTEECRQIDTVLRDPPPGRALAEVVRDELARVRGTTGAVARKPLAAALAQYNRSDSKRQARVDRSARRLTVIQASVGAFCNACEPSGICQTPECELRPVSPLPIGLSDKVGDIARRPEGVHGPASQAAWLEAQRAANARRWDRPGERERAAEVVRRRIGAPGSAERAEHGRKVSEGRRRAIGSVPA